MPFIKICGSILGLLNFIILLREVNLSEIAYLGLVVSVMTFLTGVLDFGGRSLMPIQFKVRNLNSVRANLILNWYSGLFIMLLGLVTAVSLNTDMNTMISLFYIVAWLSLEKVVEPIIGLTVATKDVRILFESITLRKFLPLVGFVFLLTTTIDPFLAYSVCLSIGSTLSLIHALHWMTKQELLEKPSMYRAWEELITKRKWTIQNLLAQINSLDVYLLRSFSNISVVGEYTSIQRLFAPMTNFLESFLSNLRVELISWDQKRLRKFISFCTFSGLGALIASSIFAQFSSDLLSLFLDKVFPNMEFFLTILLIFTPFQLLSQFYNSCLISLEQEDFIVRFMAVAAPLSIILGCVGGVFFSAVGVIAGIMFVHVISTLVKAWKIFQILRNNATSSF